ncbi:MAG: glycoside hydrolase family 3 N-terminal domain-containing protein [Gemmatimonadota bacterium]
MIGGRPGAWLAAGLAAAAAAAPAPTAAQEQEPAAAEADRLVDSLLAEMTLDEKLGQLAQYRGRWGDTGPEVPEGGEEQIRASEVGSFLGVHGAEYTREMQRLAVEESRLGIPLLFAHDVIHGFRTIFPMPLGIAASFDLEGAERAAQIAAVEAAAHGLHWTFAPMVDLSRDPRWGRIVEGFGEDPYLGSVMAAAHVRGFQGGDLADPETLLATAKHYVAYGGAEGGRDYNTVDVSERTLREIYLPPFEAAVEAGVGAIMPAFNEISGIPMHAHEHLLRDVLRDEWGFDGVVVSDYTGVMELIPHGVAADSAEAGVLALEAGVDIDMVSGIYVNDVPAAVRDGRLDEAVLDEAVRRVLRAKQRLGLFDDPYRYGDAAREAEVTLAAEHREAARELARRSFVLLKNEDGLLPLSKSVGTVAVIGPLADARRTMLGGWVAAGQAEDAVIPLEGVEAAVSADTRVVHARGAEIEGEDRGGFDAAVRAAAEADVALMFLGEHEEMSSEANNRTSLDLPGVQEELLQAVHETGTPVVVVLLSGRPLSIPWAAEHVPAILVAWFPGVEAGHALADVLFGDHAPSGKLPVSFPRTVGQVPVYYNHKNTGRPPAEDEKYTSKYIDAHWTPLYPFGHGLAYTEFEYSGLRLDADRVGPADTLSVEVTVTNAGERAGEEVVQLYVRDDVASVTRPVKELKGFERIRLEPGQSRTVSFRLPAESLAFYGPDLTRALEPGSFTVFVGTSSRETLETGFQLTE